MRGHVRNRNQFELAREIYWRRHAAKVRRAIRSQPEESPMKTTFIAIHVTPTGKRLTAPFSLQESHHQAVRAAAERAMRETHGPVHVHGWELVPSVESSAP